MLVGACLFRCVGAIIRLNPSSTVRVLISLLPHLLLVLRFNTSVLPIEHLRKLLVHVLLNEDDEVLTSDRQDDQRLCEHHDESEDVRKVKVGHSCAIQLEGVRNLQELVVDLNDEVCLNALVTGRVRDEQRQIHYEVVEEDGQDDGQSDLLVDACLAVADLCAALHFKEG